MKTTIEIPDVLLRRLRERAAKQGTTLKSLVRAAIQQFLEGGRAGGGKFKLRDGAFGGNGPAPGVREGDWRSAIELSYEGRGGSGAATVGESG